MSTLLLLVQTLNELVEEQNLTGSGLEQVQRLLEKVIKEKQNPIHGSLPYRKLNYTAKAPLTSPPITPSYLSAISSVGSADLATSPEAPISEEIALHAQSLNWSPVEIYQWVKNNIETEWYWGAMKGAEEVLHQKSGNDADQAALLVSLLRAADYPARYVRGVIEFYPEDLNHIANLIGVGDVSQLVISFNVREFLMRK